MGWVPPQFNFFEFLMGWVAGLSCWAELVNPLALDYWWLVVPVVPVVLVVPVVHVVHVVLVG